MLKVVVKRDMWLRGEGGEESYLLREEDERMCCLGFAALAAGFTPDQIRRIRTPRDIGYLKPQNPLIKATTTYDAFTEARSSTNLTCDLMQLNDDEGMEPEERERQVIELGKKIGIEFTFED